jgi:hypothetical protein
MLHDFNNVQDFVDNLFIDEHKSINYIGIVICNRNFALIDESNLLVKGGFLNASVCHIRTILQPFNYILY